MSKAKDLLSWPRGQGHVLQDSKSVTKFGM